MNRSFELGIATSVTSLDAQQIISEAKRHYQTAKYATSLIKQNYSSFW